MMRTRPPRRRVRALTSSPLRVPALVAAAFLLAMPLQSQSAAPPAAARDTAELRLTWLSVTNWLLEVGDTRVLVDGYLTRIDRSLVEADGSSRGTAVTDTAELRRLLSAAVPDLRLDWVLVGHGHWDHAFDVPAIARLTGARIVGARTVCLQAEALGLARDRCTPVEGGEVLELGEGVRARVVRWAHSGDPTTEAGRRLAAPLELAAPPEVDPRTGGLRPGFLEDYPNGGGARAYLITAPGGARRASLFWSNTANPAAWDAPLRADTAMLRKGGVDLSNLRPAGFQRPSRELLAAALRAEGLDRVDVWLGFPSAAHLRQVVPVLRPRAFIPHHWDDHWSPMGARPAEPFDPRGIRPFLDSAGVALVVPERYYQSFDPEVWRGAADTREAGRAAGDAAAREARNGSGTLRFLAAAGGGLAAGVGIPFLAGGAPFTAAGLGLTFLAAEAGTTAPPPSLIREARAIGPAYAGGFTEGFRARLQADRRRTAWMTAGIAAAAGLGWVLIILAPGYT